jgi:hypothetical protein
MGGAHCTQCAMRGDGEAHAVLALTSLSAQILCKLRLAVAAPFALLAIGSKSSNH